MDKVIKKHKSQIKSLQEEQKREIHQIHEDAERKAKEFQSETERKEDGVGEPEGREQGRNKGCCRNS